MQLKFFPRIFVCICAPFLAFFVGCTPSETDHTVETKSVLTRSVPYSGPKQRLVIGKFENKSPYQNGIFSDGTDHLGLQAQQILKTHLSQTNRFILMDRANMQELAAEADISGKTQKLTGGQILITGAVTEFGRKEVGAAASVFGKTRKQIAYAKIQVSIVDVTTSQVLFSEQDAGEYQLKSGDVLGFGSAAGYDATLNDKVLNLAMIDVVNKLVAGLESGQWNIPQ